MSLADERRICVVCGKIYTPRKYNQKTCSPECSAEHNRRLNRARKKKEWLEDAEKRKDNPHGFHIKCPVCGKVFKTWNSKRITCSRECYEKIKGKVYSDAYVEEKPHVNTMPQLYEIAKHGVNYGQLVIEMEKNT